MQEAISPDVTAVWRRVREELRASLPPSSFKLWLEPVQAVSADASTLYLSAPASARSWVERRYASRIVSALQRQVPALTGVGFVSEAEQAVPAQDSGPTYEFEGFVIGSANRFAHAAALAVAEMPTEAYNPLFLHGAPGVGKTHLLGAIESYLRRSHPAMSLLRTTAERFTAEFVGALRSGHADRFKRRHRDLDALLIDDVQFLEDKAQTAEELFHTFDSLHESGSQIVLSSERPPQALSGLADRLRDRFEWGLCVELHPPDLRTRVAVLGQLAKRLFPALAQESSAPILREIAARCSNLRQLDGALTRVVAFSSVMGSPPSASLVRDVIADRGRTHGQTGAAGTRPTVEQIQDAVCAVLHISREDLLSERRTPTVVRARRLAIHLARERLSLSLNELSRCFRRDRATILHALRTAERELQPGSETAEALHDVSSHLGQASPGSG